MSRNEWRSGAALNDADVARRVAFLLSEASQDEPIYDQAVKYALRVVSNHCCVGRDAGSADILRVSRRMSSEALRLRRTMGEVAWSKVTGKDGFRNEHQEPLSEVWRWLCHSAGTLRLEDVVGRLRQWPMVTVTTDEDRRLVAAFDGLHPLERYRQAAIVVHVCDDLGEWKESAQALVSGA